MKFYNYGVCNVFTVNGPYLVGNFGHSEISFHFQCKRRSAQSVGGSTKLVQNDDTFSHFGPLFSGGNEFTDYEQNKNKWIILSKDSPLVFLLSVDDIVS